MNTHLSLVESTSATPLPRHRILAKVKGGVPVGFENILTDQALLFLADLERRFGPTRSTLLNDRKLAQLRYDDGELPTFPAETAHIRRDVWEIAPIPPSLQDRRVEITGPVDRKMMINALNCGAKMFMADFEDAASPTFENMINGQINMYDYARNQLQHTDENSGKTYILQDNTATMLVRPRGWHLVESNIFVDGAAMSASLVDFGLHIFHNGKILAEQDRGPFYYLPKIERYQEARLWNDIFNFSEATLDIPHGTIKSTVLIETLPAAFQMNEILFELKDHVTGLNCGRWDYIFSYIKTLKNHRQFVLPDRTQVGMDRDFLKAYSLLLIETCHRRRAHAMGGMAAQIPIKNNDIANENAFKKIRADKKREVEQGHDGTWVAHPDLVPIAKEIFDEHMPGPHQILTQRQNPTVTEDFLLSPHQGEITQAGIRINISVGIRYIAAWLCGRGAVPLDNLMEDAATAEISRAQIWQWIRHGASAHMQDGTTQTITSSLVRKIFDEEVTSLINHMGTDAFLAGRYPEASNLFIQTATSADLPDFLTLSAYDILEK